MNKDLFFLDNGNGGAETLASLIYLDALNLNFGIKFAKNVNEMSPSGNSKPKSLKIVYQSFNFMYCLGKGPLLKCGKYCVGEFEPIVNFCSLKVIMFK